MNSSSSHLKPLFRLLLLIGVLQPALVSAQFGFGVSGTVEFVENPARIAEPLEDDVLSTVSVRTQIDRHTKYFDTGFNYSLVRREYENDVLGDQSRVEGSGSLVWKILPDRLNWRLTNTRSDQLIDTTQPNITDNRQVIDITSTGPTLFLPINRANLVSVSVDFGIVNFGEFDTLKQNRNSVNLGYTRLISERISASMQSSFTESNYKFISALDYKVANHVANLRYASDNFETSIEAGTHSVDRANMSANNPTFKLDMSYRVNSRLEISAAFSNSVEDVLSDLTSPGVVDQSFAGTDMEFDGNFGPTNNANIYKRKERSFGATYSEASRYSVALRYSNYDRINVGDIGGEVLERTSANVTIPYGNRWNFTASYEYSTREFSISQNLQERNDYRIGASYRLSDQINFVFSAFDTDQVGAGPVDTFAGKNYLLGITYTR